MDWTRAIEINQTALIRIVVGVIAMLGLESGVERRLSLRAYQLASRIVFKTESAVRRLIVVAARGLVLQPSQSRPFPKGLKLARKTAVRRSFPLCDTRKHFDFDDDEDDETTNTYNPWNPRIRVVEGPDPRSPLFLAMQAAQAAPAATIKDVDASHLTNRLMVIKAALENLPHQAKRLARWRARQAQKKEPKFLDPIRPGPPPGRNKNSKDEIDLILKECHALARDAIRTDTS